MILNPAEAYHCSGGIEEEDILFLWQNEICLGIRLMKSIHLGGYCYVL